MRKDGAKEFLQRLENRVQIVFVSKTCTRKRNLRQSQLRKANFEQKIEQYRCFFACAVWSHVDGKVFVSGKTANNRQQMCFCTVCRSVREKSMYGTKRCLFK